MWLMPELQPYEYVWLLDTDAFLLGPLSYDPFRLMAIRNASYGYVDVNVETAEVADGLADCVEDFLRRHKHMSGSAPEKPTMLDRYRRPPDRRWDGSKFYTNFQLARLDFGLSPGYRQLFNHVDASGGIFTRRWGADPFMFIAANLLLRDDQIVHFDDVPYLHQHLVINLPSEPPADVLTDGLHNRSTNLTTARDPLAAQFARPTKATLAKTGPGASPTGVTETQTVLDHFEARKVPSNRAAILLIRNSSHAAMAASLLKSWRKHSSSACAPLDVRVWMYTQLEEPQGASGLPNKMCAAHQPGMPSCSLRMESVDESRLIDAHLEDLEASLVVRLVNGRPEAIVPTRPPTSKTGSTSAETIPAAIASGAILLQRLGELFSGLSLLAASERTSNGHEHRTSSGKSRTPCDVATGAELGNPQCHGGSDAFCDHDLDEPDRQGDATAQGESAQIGCGSDSNPSSRWRGHDPLCKHGLILLCLDDSDDEALIAALAARLMRICLIDLCPKGTTDAEAEDQHAAPFSPSEDGHGFAGGLGPKRMSSQVWAMLDEQVIC